MHHVWNVHPDTDCTYCLQCSPCNLQQLLAEPRQVYHHGKFADAKDLDYQDGYLYRLEPVWNTSVTLIDPPTGGRWSKEPWVATTHTTATVAERPHCDGQVNEPLEIVLRGECKRLYEWVPPRFHKLNKTGQACWVDRADRTKVFLDVEQPLYFYGDLLAVVACVGIALTFAVCIAREHRESVTSRAIALAQTARNPFDAGVGPPLPEELPEEHPPSKGALAAGTHALQAPMSSKPGADDDKGGAEGLAVWDRELRESLSREMI